MLSITGGAQMFRILLNCDGGKYEYWLETYKESLALSARLRKVAKSLITNGVIEDFCMEIELVEES